MAARKSAYDWPEDDHWRSGAAEHVVARPFRHRPSAIQLAIKLRSRKNPLNHLFDKSHKHVSEGGKLIHYGDLEEGLRNRIWQTYVDECRQRGYEVMNPDKAEAAE